MLVVNSFLNVLKEKYSKEIKFPVKGIVQAAKIVFWVITIIFAASVLINKEPIYLFSGLTAISAVLLLIFKDSILGLTSGFQLLMSDLVRVGDWIEVPGQRADGEVMDVLITTVRVRNWDNTIVNIPTYYLIANSFINWRGMSDSGGRRIKRSLNIDVATVKFLNEHEIAKFKETDLLKDYITSAEKEIAAQKGKGLPAGITNLGAFRAYCYEYLKRNPKISKKFTCMVRQLDPTTEGIPLEIYAFYDGTDWEKYENLQSEIFEHFVAVSQDFGIKIYQRFFE
jgi:miniconductance mechanosensitive channel